MKTKLIVIQLFTLLLTVSCTESVKVQTRDMEKTYLIVEGLLTDTPGQDQFVKLSESLPYFDNQTIPKVSGAEVVVSDGTTDILFMERMNEEDGTGTGEYYAPEGFKAEPDRTYSLSVQATVAGVPHRYSAEAEMPRMGFTLDKIDYSYNGNTPAKLDSLWTVLMWGQDELETTSRFIACIEVNGHRIPISSTLMMEDKYFNGKKIEAFPIGLLYQTAENQKNNGPSAKFLEEGDVLTLTGYSLTMEYYEFLSNLQGDNGMASMPLLASQPANPTTNVSGDGDVLGYFAVCPVLTASVTITDPFKVIDYKE